MKTLPSQSVVLFAAALFGFAAPAHAIVTSAAEIDPAGGDSISHSNPNWGTWFTARNGGGPYTAASRTALKDTAGVFIMNFESANGYGSATRTLASNGTVFDSLSTISPYTADEKITSFTTSTGVNISVGARSFNTTTLALGTHANYGVFLVGDRSANDVMVSGTQGLTVGYANGAGVYLTFDQDLASFAVTLNVGGASNPTYYIALFNASGTVVGTYTGGVNATNALYFGVTTAAADIRSVWIGQTTSVNALVIDDIAFVPASAVPEPVTAALLGALAALAVAAAKRRRR